MAKSKIEVFQHYEDLETRRMQIVFLDHFGFAKEEIAKWTNYAVSTIKTYIRKFADLLEKALATFKKISQKTKFELLGGKQLVYLFKFHNPNNELICSKVGTTTRLPEQRLKEELRYYRNHGIEIENAEICSVIDCGDLPAEGAESYARAKYIKRYPTAFCKNDRFFGIDIPTNSFIKLIRNYLGEDVPLAERPGGWQIAQKNRKIF